MAPQAATQHLSLGLGIGWRPEIALYVERRKDLGFVEVVSEEFPASLPIPTPVRALADRGVRIIPHGLTLSLGSPDPPDATRLRALAEQARRFNAPLVSEHIAFVRAGELESGHLLPVARTRDMVNVLIRNIRIAMESLPVPLALENIATLVEWPGAELEESEFVARIIEGTGALLLLDVENLYANARNHGFDALAYLARLPLDRLAYVHVAGGIERDGAYHDTHAHAIPQGVLDLLKSLAVRARIPGVMLERDDHFPPPQVLDSELDDIGNAIGLPIRHPHHTPPAPGRTA